MRIVIFSLTNIIFLGLSFFSVVSPMDPPREPKKPRKVVRQDNDLDETTPLVKNNKFIEACDIGDPKLVEDALQTIDPQRDLKVFTEGLKLLIKNNDDNSVKSLEIICGDKTAKPKARQKTLIYKVKYRSSLLSELIQYVLFCASDKAVDVIWPTYISTQGLDASQEEKKNFIGDWLGTENTEPSFLYSIDMFEKNYDGLREKHERDGDMEAYYNCLEKMFGKKNVADVHEKMRKRKEKEQKRQQKKLQRQQEGKDEKCVIS